MAIEIKNINGYILAGGKSSRMGTDKGLLDFKGQPIVQTIIEQLQPAVGSVIIVSNNTAYGKFGLEVIPDLIKDKGPAGGIHAALSHSNSEQLFIVSCDMPFITSEAVKSIILKAFRAQITLPLYHGKTEPLFGIYSKECLPLWENLIRQEKIKLQEMVISFNLLEINVDQNDLFPASFFTNINDEGDFKKALKLLQHGN